LTTKERLEFKKKLRPKPKEVELKYVKGEKGDRGFTGKDGAKGEQGLPGKNGLDGINGRDGKDGIDGHNGDNGKSVELMAKKDKLYWKYEGEDWVFLATMPKGERGPRGASGGGGGGSSTPGTVDDLTEVVKYTDSSYSYFSGYKSSGWQVNRWDVDTVRTIATGSGTKPNSLAECQALSYSSFGG